MNIKPSLALLAFPLLVGAATPVLAQKIEEKPSSAPLPRITINRDSQKQAAYCSIPKPTQEQIEAAQKHRASLGRIGQIVAEAAPHLYDPEKLREHELQMRGCL